MACAMRVDNANVDPVGLERLANHWPVTLDVRNMDNVRMGRVSADWDGMGGIAPWVSTVI